MNPKYVLNPTKLPTRMPSPSPTLFPSRSPIALNAPPVAAPGKTFVGISQQYFGEFYAFMTPEHIYNPPVSASCLMTTSNRTVTTHATELRNLTLHLDEIGVNPQNQSDVTNIFGMLIKLEFEDFEGHMSGKIMCDLYLEMERIDKAISDFAEYEILFMVSREEFDSGTTGITEYIRSMKKVWRRQTGLVNMLYSYDFEEKTYDGVSDFTAEVHLLDEYVTEAEDAMINIEVYPYPTIMHYVSYDRYSYLDWLAEVGGFYTVVVACFFILTTRVTKLANRSDLFHRKQGILPAFSLPHRNAEEISGLRSLVMAGLGITEHEYFATNLEKQVTIF